MDAVIGEQMGILRHTAEIIDRNGDDIGAATFNDTTKNKPSNTSKTFIAIFVAMISPASQTLFCRPN